MKAKKKLYNNYLNSNILQVVDNFTCQMLTFIPKNLPADGPIDANASQLLDSIN